MRLRSITPSFAICTVGLWTLVLIGAASSAWAQSPPDAGAAKQPYNIIFVISDQESDHLLVTGDYELPARAELRRRGFDFRNHYTASALCTPSRAAFFSGTPPQVNGVFDQMETGYGSQQGRLWRQAIAITRPDASRHEQARLHVVRI